MEIFIQIVLWTSALGVILNAYTLAVGKFPMRRITHETDVFFRMIWKAAWFIAAMIVLW